MLDLVGVRDDHLHVIDTFPVGCLKGEHDPWNMFDRLPGRQTEVMGLKSWSAELINRLIGCI